MNIQELFSLGLTKGKLFPLGLTHFPQGLLINVLVACYFIILGSKITTDGDYSHEIKDTCSLEEKL